jgi:membrane protease YdiL (CAAX protease family)
MLLGLPASFIAEEVFFRGVLDTYLHQGEQGTGWPSAIYISALWGLWHLPLSAFASSAHPSVESVLSNAAMLLLDQIAVGVPLSIWWRRSGNLVVPGIPHVLLDALRNILQLVVHFNIE